MILIDKDSKERIELESKVLAAALKQSIDLADPKGAEIAHKALFRLLQRRSKLIKMPLETLVGNAHAESDGSLFTTPAAILSTIACSQNIYETLGIASNSSFEQIHKTFFRLARKLLIWQTKEQAQDDHASHSQILEALRKLWIAHDILSDPTTREDYDRQVSSLTPHIEDIAGSPLLNRLELDEAVFKIGELLVAGGLLEQAELDIACDMHKAMKEIQFGRFLVKQQFIQDYQLKAVLLGQSLIRRNVITLNEFQTYISEVDTVRTLEQILSETGKVSQTEISLCLDAIQEELDPPAEEKIDYSQSTSTVDLLLRKQINGKDSSLLSLFENEPPASEK